MRNLLQSLVFVVGMTGGFGAGFASASSATASFEEPPAPAACCKVCRKGCACGDSCISCSKTCRKGPGCACNG